MSDRPATLTESDEHDGDVVALPRFRRQTQEAVLERVLHDVAFVRPHYKSARPLATLCQQPWSPRTLCVFQAQ